MRLDLKIGSGVAIGGECYRFVERVRDHQRSPVFRHVRTDEPRIIPDRELEGLLEKSEIRFLTPAEMVEAEHSLLALLAERAGR